MTNIYNYHPITKEYLSTTVADLDPILKKPMLPAYATYDKPPSIIEGQVVLFNDGWKVKQDIRGIYYRKDNLEQIDINDLNLTIDNILTKKAPEHGLQTFDELSNEWIDDIPEIIKSSMARIDMLAEAERLKYITGGSGQSMVYDKKAQEAESFINDNSLDVSKMPHIVSEASILQKTNLEIAQNIISNRDKWVQISANIEAKRIKAKTDIKSSTTKDEIDNILASISFEVMEG